MCVAVLCARRFVAAAGWGSFTKDLPKTLERLCGKIYVSALRRIGRAFLAAGIFFAAVVFYARVVLSRVWRFRVCSGFVRAAICGRGGVGKFY